MDESFQAISGYALLVTVMFAGWFYLLIIVMISVGTFLTSVIIIAQGMGRKGKPVPPFWYSICFL